MFENFADEMWFFSSANVDGDINFSFQPALVYIQFHNPISPSAWMNKWVFLMPLQEFITEGPSALLLEKAEDPVLNVIERRYGYPLQLFKLKTLS